MLQVMCPTLLDKFKEKNSTVCNNAADALTAMHQHCFALADVAEDFSDALDHKNPKVCFVCHLQQLAVSPFTPWSTQA